MTKLSVEQVFLTNQTDLVYEILHVALDCDMDDIKNHGKTFLDENGEEVDEDDDYYDVEYDDIYQWLLVSTYYKDKVKEMGCPYLEYKGQMWAGQTFGGSSWENSGYWKVFE